MKRIIIILSFLFLINLQAEDVCDFETVKTKEDVEKVQECLISHLETLEKSFTNYDVYEKEALAKHKSLIQEEVICKKIELIYTNSKKKKSYEASYKECMDLYKERLKEWADVTESYARIRKKYKESKEKYELIELKSQLLKSAYDLIIKRNNK